MKRALPEDTELPPADVARPRKLAGGGESEQDPPEHELQTRDTRPHYYNNLPQNGTLKIQTRDDGEAAAGDSDDEEEVDAEKVLAEAGLGDGATRIEVQWKVESFAGGSRRQRGTRALSTAAGRGPTRTVRLSSA
jgi:hypothetical protein